MPDGVGCHIDVARELEFIADLAQHGDHVEVKALQVEDKVGLAQSSGSAKPRESPYGFVTLSKSSRMRTITSPASEVQEYLLSCIC